MPSMRDALALCGTTAVALATGWWLGIHYGSCRDVKESSHDDKRRIEKQDDGVTGSGSDSEYDTESELEIESTDLNDIPGEVRMSLVIRQDLGMQKGKIAAQCCHAALSCFRLMAMDSSRKSYNPTMIARWLRGGQAKITLKCPNKEIMDELFAQAIAMGVNANVIHDAGRTQIEAGSATVLGLGPAPKAVLDQITGDLKLY